MLSQLEIYIQRLMKFDWYYEYSDDHSVWTRANREHTELLGLSHSGEAFYLAYRAISQYMNEPANTRDFAILDSKLNEARALEKTE